MYKKCKPYAFLAIAYGMKHGYYGENTTEEERSKILDDFIDLCKRDMNGERVSFD